MNNRKLEKRLSDVETQLDDVWFWVFIVGLLLGFSVLKFGQPSSQVSSNPTTTATTSTVTLDKNAPKFIYPLPQKVSVSSGFGMRTHPVTGKQQMHSGVDMGAATGTPIYAVADGQVESRPGRRSRFDRPVRNAAVRRHRGASPRGCGPLGAGPPSGSFGLEGGDRPW